MVILFDKAKFRHSSRFAHFVFHIDFALRLSVGLLEKKSLSFPAHGAVLCQSGHSKFNINIRVPPIIKALAYTTNVLSSHQLDIVRTCAELRSAVDYSQSIYKEKHIDTHATGKSR